MADIEHETLSRGTGSHRDRLHALEGEAASARYAREALSTARQARDRAFSRWEKLVGLALLTVGTLASVAGAVAAIFAVSS